MRRLWALTDLMQDDPGGGEGGVYPVQTLAQRPLARDERLCRGRWLVTGAIVRQTDGYLCASARRALKPTSSAPLPPPSQRRCENYS